MSRKSWAIQRDTHPKIQALCKNRLLQDIIWSLDRVYGHKPIMDDKEVWTYLREHPLLKERFKLDQRYWSDTIGTK
ncbi:MAG: hypothetical protein RL244_2158 [Pseudomonadota bacterium]|jgi:hypothetical protein